MIWWLMKGFYIYITYDCEDDSNNQDNDAIKTVANKIPCWWKKHEKACNTSCEQKLNGNNDVNFTDETPSELRWLYHRRIQVVAMCVGKSSLNVTLTHAGDKHKQTTSKTKNMYDQWRIELDMLLYFNGCLFGWNNESCLFYFKPRPIL